MSAPGTRDVTEHDPPPGMVPAVEDALRAWVVGACAPRGAHRTEANVVCDVGGKQTVGDQQRWTGSSNPSWP